MNSFLLNSLNKNIDISSFSYRYYNWRITDLLNLQSARMVQSAEFVFQINGVDQSMNGVSIRNPLGSSPRNEEPSKLIDNNLSTKWFIDGLQQMMHKIEILKHGQYQEVMII